MQDGIKDCGICSLLSIIRFYGGDVSKEYLREITNTNKEGVSLYNLMLGAEKIGFDTKAVQGTIKNIEVNNLPCIAHIIVNKNYHHFLVLYSIDHLKSKVTLMDPAKGKKVITISEFNLLSSGNFLFLKPRRKLPILKLRKVVYSKIIDSIQTNKKQLLIISLLTISFFIFTLITSFHFKFLMEYALYYHLSLNLFLISIVLLVFYVFKNINLLIRNLLLFQWTSLIDYATSSCFYKQILLLPYLFYKNRTTGEILSRFKDLNVVRSFFSNFFCIITTDLLSAILFLIIMFQIHNKLSILLFIFSLLFLLLPLIFKNIKKKHLLKIHRQEDAINSYLVEGISNVDTMKGSHLEKRFIDKFSLAYKNFLDYVYRYLKVDEYSKYLKNNINDFLLLFIYGFGSYFILKEELMLSSFIVFQSFFSYYLNSFQRLISLLEEYPNYKVSLNRVEDIFMISEENFQDYYYYLSYDLKGNILFHNLNYKIGSKTLFANLDLEISQGDKVLLCGESGSGKSTLMKILLRYIEVEYNHVKIAGIDINHYHLENLRQHITYISSNEYLFSDTIRNNICLYKDYPEADFEKVCNLCLVDDLIKSKNLTYDSFIEENGFNFSNGERQRIILARAILKNSSIYIFDEALAQIDVNNEKKILLNLFSYLEEKTIIIISHRSNNKKYFNRLLTLKGGKIVEEKKL